MDRMKRYLLEWDDVLKPCLSTYVCMSLYQKVASFKFCTAIDVTNELVCWICLSDQFQDLSADVAFVHQDGDALQVISSQLQLHGSFEWMPAFFRSRTDVTRGPCLQQVQAELHSPHGEVQELQRTVARGAWNLTNLSLSDGPLLTAILRSAHIPLASRLSHGPPTLLNE